LVDEEMDIFTDDEDVFKDTKKKKGLKKFLARYYFYKNSV